MHRPTFKTLEARFFALSRSAARADPTPLASLKNAMTTPKKPWSVSGMPEDDKDVAKQIGNDLPIVAKFKQAEATL